jgi:dGTPase
LPRPSQSVEDVRAAGKPLVASDVMNEHQAILRRFLMARMYRHWKVNRSRSHAKRIIRQLFDLLVTEPELLPPAWQEGGDGPRGQRTARRVCDYIAGMTDDFAIDEHKRLFNLGAEFRATLGHGDSANGRASTTRYVYGILHFVHAALRLVKQR